MQQTTNCGLLRWVCYKLQIKLLITAKNTNKCAKLTEFITVFQSFGDAVLTVYCRTVFRYFLSRSTVVVQVMWHSTIMSFCRKSCDFLTRLACTILFIRLILMNRHALLIC